MSTLRVDESTDPGRAIVEDDKPGKLPYVLATLLGALANLLAVIQFAGNAALVAGLLVTLLLWGWLSVFGRKTRRWLVRHRRDLLILIAGATLGVTAGVVWRPQAPFHAPAPPPASTPSSPETIPPPQAPTPDPGPVTEPTSQTVYRTPKGEKYHRGDCGYVQGKAIALSLKEAKGMDLTPCKVCRPPR